MLNAPKVNGVCHVSSNSGVSGVQVGYIGVQIYICKSGVQVGYIGVQIYICKSGKSGVQVGYIPLQILPEDVGMSSGYN